MNSFLEPSGCPNSWKLKKQKKPKIRVDMKGALFGSCVHNMMTLYFGRIGNKPSNKMIEAVAKDVFVEGWDSSLAGLEKRRDTVMRNFIEYEQTRVSTWKQYKPTFIEKRLEGSFVCITDAYFREMERGLDWKTGNVSMLGENEMRQGKINMMMLEEKGYPCKSFDFVLLRTGRVMGMPQVSTAWINSQAEKMMSMIDQGIFPKNKSVLCGWCAYQLSCEFEDQCLWVGI